MGNSNQCKIEHKISSDYEFTKAAQRIEAAGCNSPRAIPETKGDHTQLTLWR